MFLDGICAENEENSRKCTQSERQIVDLVEAAQIQAYDFERVLVDDYRQVSLVVNEKPS